MDERVRKALSRELSRAELRIETQKNQIKRLEGELEEARADLIASEDDARAFRDMLTPDPHAHTIDRFPGTLVVRPSYRPDLDPFTETETARMMGVV